MFVPYFLKITVKLLYVIVQINLTRNNYGDTMSNEITCDDVLAFEHLFSMVPAFVLERMAKRNTNLVSKFESKIVPRLQNLNDDHKNKLDFILNSDIEVLQTLMDEAYQKSGKKQFRTLANPNYKQFIEQNLDEIRKLRS